MNVHSILAYVSLSKLINGDKTITPDARKEEKEVILSLDAFKLWTDFDTFLTVEPTLGFHTEYFPVLKALAKGYIIMLKKIPVYLKILSPEFQSLWIKS